MKTYIHKKTNYIAKQTDITKYSIHRSDDFFLTNLPACLIDNSEDWEEVKIEKGDIDFISAIENFLYYAKQKGIIKDWRIEL
jgi:phage portal protein BeeE